MLLSFFHVVMTSVYGVTYIGAKKQIHETFPTSEPARLYSRQKIFIDTIPFGLVKLIESDNIEKKAESKD
mgnify:CR=1 FL=1